MDEDQYKYLEENFGLGNPTSIEFIPLIKKHIDALVGEYLGTPIIPKVQCKDAETIANIGREKQLKIALEIQKVLKKQLTDVVSELTQGKVKTDPLLDQSLNNLLEDINTTFVSEYEIAAQNVVEYLMQSRQIDLQTVLRTICTDVFISGEGYYRVSPTSANTNISLRVLDPRDTFIEYNRNSPYVKDSPRAVVRTYMTKQEVLAKYGKDLTKKDIDTIKNSWEDLYDTGSYYIKSGAAGSTGILKGKEMVVPGSLSNYPLSNDQIPVYEVEWIETDSDMIMQRYETIRIGGDIFILKGKNENVIRSKDNPEYCSLSVNGVYFLNRGTRPYSMVLACASLQDRYNILNFYRDRLIASSGTTGDFVDVSLLPSFLGTDLSERLEKYIAYKKGGLALLDSSQPGRLESGQAALTTIFNGYDDTLKAQAVQAIQIAIQAIEDTVSSITGVFRERLNGIEQRDAVSNIKQGVINSFTITKQYYHQMDLIVNEILLDCLNTAKIVYKNGLTGTIILGDKYQKIFTALPEYFTLTDYDIRIITSTDILKDLEYVRQMVPELTKAGILSPDIILDIMTAKSITEIKSKAAKSFKKQEKKNDQLQQLSQKLEEMSQQFQQCQQELQKAQQKIEQLNESKMQLEKQKLQLEFKVDWFNAQTDRTYKSKMAEEQSRRTDIEIAQLSDGNPYNDKLRSI